MSLSWRRSGLVLGLSLVSTLVAEPMVVRAAEPGETAEVTSLVDQGLELRRAGRDTEALVKFQRALEIRKTPRIQSQVALAEQALGLWRVAERDLMEALASKDDPWIKKNYITLNKTLGVIQSHLGTLEVWGTPPGAEIFVDEDLVGKLPAVKRVRVAGETAIVRVRADGYSDVTRTVRVPPGETVREHVALVQLRAPKEAVVRRNAPAAMAPPVATDDAPTTASVDPGGAPGGGDDSPQAAAAPSDHAADRTAGKTSLVRPLAWAAATVATAGLVFGVTETFLALGKKKEFESHMGPDPVNPGVTIKDCGTTRLVPACKPIRDAYNRDVTYAIVGYAVGAALAVGSTVLFAISSPADGATQSALSCAPDPFAKGATCLLRF